MFFVVQKGGHADAYKKDDTKHSGAGTVAKKSQKAQKTVKKLQQTLVLFGKIWYNIIIENHRRNQEGRGFYEEENFCSLDDNSRGCPGKCLRRPEDRCENRYKG